MARVGYGVSKEVKKEVATGTGFRWTIVSSPGAF